MTLIQGVKMQEDAIRTKDVEKIDLKSVDTGVLRLESASFMSHEHVSHLGMALSRVVVEGEENESIAPPKLITCLMLK
ncbi:TPA: hypothetical protein MYN95_000483 [Klebsiella pneumoniae]|nr:hypothetical protein [Klebsiella pneumoniae]